MAFLINVDLILVELRQQRQLVRNRILRDSTNPFDFSDEEILRRNTFTLVIVSF